MDDFIFAARLRELRERAGLSQIELGLRSGIKPNSISNWELGFGRPLLPSIRRLCKGLGCSADELLGLEHLQLNAHELACLEAYRRAPERIRQAADVLLGVSEPEA